MATGTPRLRSGWFVDEEGRLIVTWEDGDTLNIDTVTSITTVDEVSQCNIYGQYIDGLEASNVPIQVGEFGKLLVEEVDLVDEVTNVTSVDTVDTLTSITNTVTVTGTVDVDDVNSVTDVVNVQSVDLVDEVSKAVLYGTDYNDIEVPLLSSANGALDVIRIQDGSIIDEGYVTFSALANQYTTKVINIEQPTDPIRDKYMMYVINPTTSDLTGSFQNLTSITDIPVAAEICSDTVSHAPSVQFSSDAWSSCFTSINSILTDESGDLNDNVPPGTADVTFAFGAVNDAIYFGSDEQFRAILLGIGQAGVYTASGIWEYWDGDSWEALTVLTAYPGTGTSPWKSTGASYISFNIENDWAAYDIDGDPTSQYWIRFRITSYTSRTTSPGIISGTYLRYKDVIGCMNIIEGAFNGGEGARIFLSNDDALTNTVDVPVYWQLRKY